MSAHADALLTDLYQLTMLQAYYDEGLEQTATFEFFVRDLPPERGFLLAAGLEQAVDFLEHVRFAEADLEWLAGSGFFREDFVEWLSGFRFRGDVEAMPEGTAFFADEPILRVTAPLPQAQLVESRLINILHFQTLIASKAARAVLAAPDKLLVDFGMRRAHGAEAGLLAARAAYLAGFAGTATVRAGAAFGIPVYGTMAHSFVQAHDTEEAAFERFARTNPGNVVLLIDTYDTEAAARKCIDLAPALAAEGIAIKAVRLDSGDLAAHAHRVRAILDEGGLRKVRIFASGSIDEHVLAEMVRSGAPVDGCGVGTRLDTSADVPYLDCAYKLEEYAGEARRKRSEGKATWPGRKQVYRHFDEHGMMEHDVVALESEGAGGGEALLAPAMRAGRRVEGLPDLAAAREHARGQLERLPEALRALGATPTYPAEISPALRALAERVDAQGH
ncbi:MAG: nicotinate phosphoribosyltransferase [Gammaproteobacteria bacterium]|nr:nicotinate phosphoribosyltransferase [Gammaproteobacteria bacterium]